jgi:hypothetical protein
MIADVRLMRVFAGIKIIAFRLLGNSRSAPICDIIKRDLPGDFMEKKLSKTKEQSFF